jgi:hypothetical protein
MKIKPIDLGWLGALILMLALFKCIDLASGFTAEQPAYPITHAGTARR